MAVVFDHDRYRDRIQRSQQRLAAARRFEEPDQVPVDFIVTESFCCKMLGVNISHYYQDREVSLEVQIAGQQWAWEHLNDDRTEFALYLDVGPIFEGLLFGAEIVRPDNTSPWARHVIHTPADVEKLEVPDPATNPGVEGCSGSGRRYATWRRARESMCPSESGSACIRRSPRPAHWRDRS